MDRLNDFTTSYILQKSVSGGEWVDWKTFDDEAACASMYQRGVQKIRDTQNYDVRLRTVIRGVLLRSINSYSYDEECKRVAAQEELRKERAEQSRAFQERAQDQLDGVLQAKKSRERKSRARTKARIKKETKKAR